MMHAVVSLEREQKAKGEKMFQFNRIQRYLRARKESDLSASFTSGREVVGLFSSSPALSLPSFSSVVAEGLFNTPKVSHFVNDFQDGVNPLSAATPAKEMRR